MAENPKVEALRRNFPFIQESMATSGLTTIAGHLLRLDLITGENHRDIIEPCGIGPDRKAAMLMTSVEVRIRDNPDVYFTRFIEALRRSHLGNVADRLVQALPEDQRYSTYVSSSAGTTSSPILTHSKRCRQHSPSTFSPSSPPTQRSRLDESYNALMPPSPSPPATTPSAVADSSLAQVHQHFLSPVMQQYVKYIKNYYMSKKTPVYEKESNLLHFKCKSFVSIALVHKDLGVYRTDSEKNEMLIDRLHGHVDVILKKKMKLCICEVCKCENGRPAQCVLVEGAPGVGKTTFAYELCKRWTREEILQEWPVVVIIKLRDHRTRTAQNMYDLLYHPRPEVKQAVVDELIDQDGKGMLLILDGYDELTDSQRDFNSVIQQLMSRELLCQSTLMVTSRPLATRTLHNNFVESIDQHIEVLGFTEKNIEEYIQATYRNKKELIGDFKSYLSSHPFSSALMFNPLQCAIVTDLYRSHWECGDKGFAPKTLTELYTGLVHIMLLRYLTQHLKYNVQKITDLSDLPEEVSQHLKLITELAAEGIENQQYVFDKQADKVPSESLGLMQAEEEVISGTGTSESYNFLHLTLQEYLAAVNYSQQCSSPEQLSQLLTQDDLFPLKSFLENYGKKRKHTSSSSATHWPVVLFVAGRTKLDGVSPDILMAGIGRNILKVIKRQWKSGGRMDCPLTEYSEVNVPLLHLLFETQSPQLIQSTLVTSRKYLSVSGSSALDWFVIGYCIANSTSTWRVEKKGNDSPKYFDQLVMGLRLGPEECSGGCKIGSLHISGQWTGNLKILSNLQPYAKSLTEMKVVGNKQREQSNPEKSRRKSVSEEVPACYPMVENFTIDNLEISYSDCLISFISQHSNLQFLSLNQCNLSSIATSLLLLSPNNRLHKLTLNHCTIQIPDHTNSAAISCYQLTFTSHTADTGNFSLEITGSLHAINYILSQPRQFYANTLTILKVTIVSGTTDSPQVDTSFYPNLVTFEIISQSAENTYLHSISHKNNLCTLSLARCHLSNEYLCSLIHQSPNNRLHKLTLDDCTIQLPDHTNSAAVSCYQLTFTSPTDTGSFSLGITGSLYAINYILSQPHQFYTNTLTVLKVTIVSGTTHLLQIDASIYPNLKKLDITSEEETLFLHVSVLVSSQWSNLCLLSMKRCYLTCDTVRSLIHSLQSSHCELQELTLDDCISDHTHTTTASSKLKLKSLGSGNISLEFTGYCCDISHWLSQLFSYTQLTELILHLRGQDSTTADTLQEILLYHHILDSFKMDLDQSFIYFTSYVHLPLSIPQFIGLEQNNLRNLSLSWCILSGDAFRSLIHSLHSPHCKLYKLALHRCTISLSKDTQQTTILTKINTIALHSLDISWSVLDQMMLCINPFTQSLTELILHVDNDTHTCTSGVETILQEIPSNCPLLETLKVDCDFLISLPLSVPQFVGLQRSNLHTLSLWKFNISNDFTQSLIHSLQSPHCKLYKLALYLCTIPTTDHTQLTTAIVKSTTITHLLFIDSYIDTPSLTALASGLKHNTTIEQLAVDKYVWDFIEDQFQMLIDAVDSSAVKKLWLINHSKYKRWFSDCTTPRNHVDIEWYRDYKDLYNKW